MSKKSPGSWDKVDIQNDRGECVSAQAPVIVSASRSTDIPAFYSDWFMERLAKGYLRWTNPFNNKPLYVSFRNTRLIVFWSKNPKPMLRYIDELERRGLNFYFQFTLNDYVAEGLEPNVPPVEERIETFKRLSDRIGPDRVIWRFDPLLITEKTPPERLLGKVISVGDRLKGYTRRLVFSFADISNYARVRKNLQKAGFNAREFTQEEQMDFAKKLAGENHARGWNLSLGTCAESIDLEAYGIEHNRCIDDRLMIRCFSHDPVLMEFLGIDTSPKQGDLFSAMAEPALPTEAPRSLRDKGQRLACGCMRSKDIGEYNTCPHRCLYCYANTSPDSACNVARHAKRGESISE